MHGPAVVLRIEEAGQCHAADCRNEGHSDNCRHKSQRSQYSGPQRHAAGNPSISVHYSCQGQAGNDRHQHQNHGLKRLVPENHRHRRPMQAEQLVEPAVIGEYQTVVEPEIEQHDYEQKGIGPDRKPDVEDVAVYTQLAEIVAVQVDIGQGHETGLERCRILRCHSAYQTGYAALHSLYVTVPAEQQVGVTERIHILRQERQRIPPPVRGLRDIPEDTCDMARLPLYQQVRIEHVTVQTACPYLHPGQLTGKALTYYHLVRSYQGAFHIPLQHLYVESLEKVPVDIEDLLPRRQIHSLISQVGPVDLMQLGNGLYSRHLPYRVVGHIAAHPPVHRITFRGEGQPYCPVCLPVVPVPAQLPPDIVHGYKQGSENDRESGQIDKPQ